MKTVFIDGQEGTTGLQISDRLRDRHDIELVEIPRERRKDAETKATFLNEADLTILCLPDQAARESVGLISDPRTKVIDASNAHRTGEGWTYGLPELNMGQRKRIETAQRVSNPGCYATGFILAVSPLVTQGILPPDYPVTVNAVSGYSGGGKRLIRTYEDPDAPRDESLAHRPYALGLQHKHVPEMQQWTGLTHPPLFSPSVGRFYKGMLVSIPLVTELLSGRPSPESLRNALAEHYETEAFVQVMPFESDDHLASGFLSPTECNGTNRTDLFVFGHEQQALLVARLDNLGKGAAGAAVQNMNIMLGLDERIGLSP